MTSHYYKLVESVLDEYCRILDIEKNDLLTSRVKPRPTMRLVFAQTIRENPHIAITLQELAKILRMHAHGTLLRGIDNLNNGYDNVKLYKKLTIKALCNIWYEDKVFKWDSSENIKWHLKETK